MKFSTRAGLHTFRALPALSFCALGLCCMHFADAQADMYLNEIWTHGPGGVEIYNSGPNPVDLKGWTISATTDYTVTEVNVVQPGGRVVLPDLGGIISNIGGIIGLIDDIKNVQDSVEYGIVGGAPAPPPFSVYTPSLARTPDASNQPAPPLDPIMDSSFWTIDLNSSPGAPNNLPNPNLGRDICINEMMANPASAPGDSLEFCGPASFGAAGTELDEGWYITTAFGVQFLTGVVPASGFLGIQVDKDLDLQTALRVDLFSPTGVRVYQKSIAGTSSSAMNFGDCPDGSAPADGWDFFTCGGGSTFFALEPTYGASNTNAPSCGEEPPTEPPGDTKDDTGRDPEEQETEEYPTGGSSEDPNSRLNGKVEEHSWGVVKKKFTTDTTTLTETEK